MVRALIPIQQARIAMKLKAKLKCETQRRDLAAQNIVQELKRLGHAVRTEGIPKIAARKLIEAHPWKSVGLAAAGGFLSMTVLKLFGAVTQSSPQRVVVEVKDRVRAPSSIFDQGLKLYAAFQTIQGLMQAHFGSGNSPDSAPQTDEKAGI